MKRTIKLDLLTEIKNAYSKYILEKIKLEERGIDLLKIKGLSTGKFIEFEVLVPGILDEIDLTLANIESIEEQIERTKSEDKRIYFLSILNELVKWRNNLKKDWKILKQRA